MRSSQGKGYAFLEESSVVPGTKEARTTGSFAETFGLLSSVKDHGRNSKVWPCPWQWFAGTMAGNGTFLFRRACHVIRYTVFEEGRGAG